MQFFPYFDDDLLHTVILALSVLLLIISVRAYRKRPSSRYLFLVFAFLFLLLSQTVDAYESMFMSGDLITIPVVELHLSHFLSFVMLVNFILALTRPIGGETRV